jgi:hypothetical protein
MKKTILSMILFLTPAICIAEEAAKEGLPVLDKVLGYIPAEGAIITVGALVLEAVFRLVKTPKPLSIMHVIGAAFGQVGAICTKIGALLDKVLPQKVG